MRGRLSVRCAAVLVLAAGGAPPVAARAQGALPSPLGLADVVRVAGERRAEIDAARAVTRAAAERPAIVSALPDPMVSSSLDHLPFMLGGADVSLTVEQQLPLSGLRAHRRAAALAEVDRLRADTARAGLDVGLQAATAFLMLQERQRTQALVSEQIAFATDVVAAANARYAAGTAPQSDVLRAEVEVARLEAGGRALVSDVRGWSAMLATSLGLDADTTLPPLAAVDAAPAPPSWPALRAALEARPELTALRASIARAGADVQVMRDMSRPMATIRTGPAYTMNNGSGWMAMVGVSLPIWRGKLRAGVAEAQAMQAMSEAELRAMTRMFEGEVAVAASQVEAWRDRRHALHTNVLPRARMAIAPAIAGYTAGQLPLVSVIEAVQALWTVQADVITADVELGLARVRLGRAVGSFEEVLR
jgi:outer membrane protein TolC